MFYSSVPYRHAATKICNMFSVCSGVRELSSISLGVSHSDLVTVTQTCIIKELLKFFSKGSTEVPKHLFIIQQKKSQQIGNFITVQTQCLNNLFNKSRSISVRWYMQWFCNIAKVFYS